MTMDSNSAMVSSTRHLGGAQAVIPAGLQGIFKAIEDPLAGVRDPRGLAVNRTGGVSDDASEILHEGLMAETNPKIGSLSW